MTKRSRTQAPPAPAPAGTPAPGADPRSLLILCALGVASAMWAVFLWWELISLRSGGTPFCAMGGQLDCAAVWDSPFATAIHRFSGVPVAGWGVAWGLVAALLPFLARTRQAQGLPAADFVSGTRLTAAAGAATVLVMIAVSLSERAFCLGCIGTYLLVGGYALIALWTLRALGLPEAGRAVGASAGLVLGAYLLLLLPGLRTPHKGDAAGREAVEAAAQAARAAAVVPPTTQPAAAPTGALPVSAAERPGPSGLREFISALPAAQQQALSNALFLYRSRPPGSVPPARALHGKPDAPVRLTEWTDVLCSHCAELHETVQSLRRQLPPGSFSVEPRQFPLEGECNRAVRMRGLPVRCVAAKALICMEGRAEAENLAGVLFARQRQLAPDLVFDLASPYISRDDLQRCIADPATQKKLDADITLAESHGITGTPLVLLNGRQVSPFAPLLFALVTTKGSPDDPAFDLLPPPNPMAGDDGHGH
jgi:serine/threonine-protein kinase